MWDQGQAIDLAVVLRAPRQELDGLPYDLLQAGRKLSFNLGQLFPNLSYPVVDALNRIDLDKLYEAQQKHGSDKLGDNGTKDFILRHVFQVAPELIKQPTDLLQLLLRRHYRGQRMPPVLEERLVQLLKAGGQFDDWPLEQLISDPRALVEFIQERWAVFVDRMTRAAGAVHEHGGGYNLTYSGPVGIPFGHEDVRVYVDSLFLDGTLRPVAHEDADKLAGQWVQVGLRMDPEEDRLHRLNGLLKLLEGGVPAVIARHQDWTAFALRWAELMALWRTFLIAPKSEVMLPVTCVEHGWWHDVAPRFMPGEAAPAFLRRAKDEQVKANLRAASRPVADQGAVWEAIASRQREDHVHSATGAMNDLYRQKEKSLADYERAFPVRESAVGMAVALNGRMVGADLFDQPSTAAKLWAKLIRSYAMDAEPGGEQGPVARERAERLLKRVAGARVESYPSIALGHDLRLEGDRATGAALVYEGIVVHMAVFRIHGCRSQGETGGIASASARRRMQRRPGNEGRE